MTDLALDLRLAWRQWVRRPVLPTAILLTLATGLGLALAAFAVTWAVVWKPLEVADAGRLVWIASESTAGAGASSPGAALTWQADAHTLDGLAAIRPVTGALTIESGAERSAGALVSASIADVLAVAPVVGRHLTPDDDRPGAPRVLLLSHALWQSRFGGRPDVVGRALELDGRPATIVGVLPPLAATLVPGADWWAPLALAPSERANIGPRYLSLIGRLAPGLSPAAARDELAAIGAALDLRADDGAPLGVRVTPLAAHLTAGARTSLVLLLAASVLLVLIACANAAALLLTRAQERRAELALRASLGASPGRLARQLVVEAGLLSTLSSAGGLLVAVWIVDLLRAWLPADVPRLADARVDGLTAVAALGAGTLVTLATGLVPAAQGARVDLQTVLRQLSATIAGGDRARRWFAAAQVAFAVTVACAGALVVRSAAALDTAPRGYEAAGVVTASLTVPTAYHDAEAIGGLVARAVSAVAAVPGVGTSAAASHVPLAGGSAGSDVFLAGTTPSDGVDRQARVRLVSAGYLSTLGVRVIAGRDVDARDGGSTRPVVVVNETLARRLAADGGVVGREVVFGVPVFNGPDGARRWQVVGVAADTWDRGPRAEVTPEILMPIAQAPDEVFFWISRELQLAARVSGASRAAAPAIRRAVADVDPGIAIGPVTPIEARLSASFARERLLARLLSAVGAASALLALLGLAAMVHHDVQRRRRDLAIRLAMGATPTSLVRTLVTAGLRLAAAGAAAGLVLTTASSGLLSSLLFGVAPRDPLTLGAVALVVVALAGAAAWLPARRIALVDPSEALRLP